MAVPNMTLIRLVAATGVVVVVVVAAVVVVMVALRVW